MKKKKQVTIREKKEIKSEAKTMQNKQIKLTVTIMLVALFLIIFVYFISETSRKFNYMGFKFEKRQESYYARIGISEFSAGVVSTNNYDFRLKNDPRKLEEIPVNAFIRFIKQNLTYVSIEPSLIECSDLYVSLIDMGRFFGAFGIQASGKASPNLTFSLENNISYITCENIKNSTVIIIQNSTQNIIEQQGNCYILNVANCEINKVKERFFVSTLISHREINQLV